MNVFPASWSAACRRAFKGVLWLDAVHAATISAVPVLLAVFLGQPSVSWMAISSFWACYGDPGGPMRNRIGAMLLLGIVGAIFCFLASASAPYLWLLLPLTFLCCTAGGLLRVWGPGPAVMGTLLSAGFVVSCELPARHAGDSLLFGALFLGGALWAILMTAVVWRRRPWKDATHAVAHGFRALADYSDALAQLYSGLGSGDDTQALAAVSRTHRGALRSAIEAARGRIEEVSDSRPSRAARGRQLRFLIHSVESSFVALVAAGELMESHRHAWRAKQTGACLTYVLHRHASLCNAIAATSNVADTREAERLSTLLARFDAGLNDIRELASAGNAELAAMIPALETLRRGGHDVASSLFGMPPDEEAAGAPAAARLTFAPWLEKARVLRENLHWESDALRHALRVGVGATIAVALSKTFTLNHGYWISLTLVFILQPYFASTWTRTLERIFGSVLGAIGASLLGLLLSSPLSVALAVLPIALGTFVSRNIHYALFTFFVTSQFVLVSHIQQPLIDEPTLAALRGLNSVFGGILALAVGYFLWPSSEPREVAGALAHALDKHARYIRELLHAKSGNGAQLPMAVALRREACLAADNAEASLQRMQQSPLHREGKYDRAVALLSTMRRMTATGTVLEMQPPLSAAGGTAPGLALDRYAVTLADAIAPEPAPSGKTIDPSAANQDAAAAFALPGELGEASPSLTAPLARLAEEVRRASRLLARVRDRPRET